MEDPNPLPSGPGLRASTRHRPTPLVQLATLLLSILGLGTLGGCTAPPEEVPLAYVAVGGGNHVRVIDLSDGPGGGETLRRLYTGAGPWRLEPSPDGRLLWIQHWYAGITTVLDLDDHEVAATLPLRGPGTFSVDGDAYYSFHWPDDKLYTVDPRTFERQGERATEVREVYDLMPARHGRALYLAQHDPLSRGPSPRYGYVVVYPHEQDPEKAAPGSLPTGVEPVGLVAVPGQPFFFTIDSGTNGLSLINEQHDGRAVAVCPAPRDVAFHLDGDRVTRMAVICWLGDGDPTSQVVVFRTDFTARPWPALEVVAQATVSGGLSAVEMSADPDRLWVTDRTGGHLLELAVHPGGETPSGGEGAPGKLEIRREIDTGAVPLDLMIRYASPQERDRIAGGKTRGRRLAEETLARLIDAGEPFAGLSWQEVVVPREQGSSEEGSDEDVEEEGETAPPLRWSLRPPDALRVEHPGGGFRLARDGHSLLVDAWGRFWVAPRQELLAAVYALPALTVEEAVRRLAGDVADSPWLSGGLALDLATEVEDPDGSRSILLGADRAGLRVAQLWVDAESGRPTGLLEQLPNFEPSGVDFHGGGAAMEMVETQFLGFTRVDDRLWMPSQIERWVEGRQGPLVRLEDFELLPETAGGIEEQDVRFDLARLGGAKPALELFAGGPATMNGGASQDGKPGRAAPIFAVDAEAVGSVLPGPQPPRVAYASNPPASGPHLPYAADWGVHRVPVPLPLQVHNLLDGGVALQWSCPGGAMGCPELVAKLEAYARETEQVLVAPYPWLPEGAVRLVLTAWGRVQPLESFNREAIDAFVEAWGGVDHHAEHAPSSGHK